MRVLVVEDEIKIANAIKKGLEQLSFAVDVAYDGQAGYDLAASESYDVIILDLMLPKIDGITICKNLRQEDVHTPILMLTAKGEVEDKVQGLNSGADDYLPKPFAFSELVARIRALTRRPAKTNKSILSVNNDLIMDTTKFEVTRGNKLIYLSRKEFAILQYFLLNQGSIITKDQIIDKVWSFDADVLPNTVEVYIGYLRNKLEKPFPNSPKLIKTVRGFGYKIDNN